MTKLNSSIPTATYVATRRQILFVAIGDLIPDPDNPRKHGRAQISAIARSIEAFGFNAPILVDKNNKIVAGHGRYEAAKLLGLDKVPIVSLSHLTETQARAYLLADNKLTDRSTWDDNKLAIQLKELSDLALDFEIEAIGFEPPEIGLRDTFRPLADGSLDRQRGGNCLPGSPPAEPTKRRPRNLIAPSNNASPPRPFARPHDVLCEDVHFGRL